MLFLLCINTVAIAIIRYETDLILNQDSVGEMAAKQIAAGQLAVAAMLLPENPGINEQFSGEIIRNMQIFADRLIAENSRPWNDIVSANSDEYTDFAINRKIIVWKLLMSTISYDEMNLMDAIRGLYREVGCM